MGSLFITSHPPPTTTSPPGDAALELLQRTVMTSKSFNKPRQGSTRGNAGRFVYDGVRKCIGGGPATLKNGWHCGDALEHYHSSDGITAAVAGAGGGQGRAGALARRGRAVGELV